MNNSLNAHLKCNISDETVEELRFTVDSYLEYVRNRSIISKRVEYAVGHSERIAISFMREIRRKVG